MIEVLHLYYEHQHKNSITKIVTNLLENCPNDQYYIGLPIEINQLVLTINKIKPKILHFHFNLKMNINNLYRRLDYKPIMVQTLHADIVSEYPDVMDKIICIHKPCYDKNDPSKSIIIENTADVEVTLKTGEKDVCSSFRFVPYRINKPIVEAYESIEKDIHLYGELSNNNYMSDVYSFLKKDSNVKIFPYSNKMEKTLTDYKVYAFYLDEETNHSDYCYGLCVMEAAASGIPVVAIQRTQNYQKYIIDGYNGFIVNNIDDFAKACNKLLKDEETYSVFKRNAVKNALALDNCMPKIYHKLYSELLKAN